MVQWVWKRSALKVLLVEKKDRQWELIVAGRGVEREERERGVTKYDFS